MFLDHSLGVKEGSTPNYVNYGLVQDTKYKKKHSNFNVYLVNQSETTIKDFMFLYITMVPYYNSLIQVYKHVTMSSWIFFCAVVELPIGLIFYLLVKKGLMLPQILTFTMAILVLKLKVTSEGWI